VSDAYRFRPMSQADAEQIARWHYPPPFDFYDAAADADDLAELLDPARRGDEYVSVEDDTGELAGFFQFKQSRADAIEIGLGLRPDRTGQGFGGAFLDAGLQYGRSRFESARIVLTVATFNRRAIIVYERAGFAPVRTYMHATNGGEWEFLEMELREP
jgi:[ribosomal protein S18]-alanine N-acetyltransferase